MKKTGQFYEELDAILGHQPASIDAYNEQNSIIFF